MSRFFRSGQDSESESDLSSSSSGSEFSDDEHQQQRPTGTSGANRFARATFDSDSDSDADVKRVVKSPKEKHMEEVNKLSRAILKSIRANEWQAASEDFDKLGAAVPKLVKALKGESLPSVFIRCLTKLEDSTVAGGLDKEDLAKLSASDARSFNKLKQRMRKHNKAYSKQIAEYRANPVESAEEEEEEAHAPSGAASDSEEEQAVPSAKQRASGKSAVVPVDSDSESDDSYWGTGSEVSSSESDESDDERRGRVGFSRWLKKEPAKDEGGAKEEGGAKKARKDKTQRVAVAAATAAAAAAGADDDDGFATVGKGGKVVQKPVVTAETLNKNLAAISDARGRKSTNKQEMIQMLETLLGVAANPLQRCKVLMALISAQFDNSASGSYMPLEQWGRAQNTINELLGTLEENRQIAIYETADVHEDDSDVTYTNEPITLRGSVVAFIDRLDDEFTRSLQNIDPHTPDYIERMRDSVPLYVTIVRAQSYFERNNIKDSLCRVVLRRLEHLYYRTDQVNHHVEEAAARLPGSAAPNAGGTAATIQRLCSF
ncbi:Translation initiation factor 3 subunit c, partial [Coemansia guatemalensis]